MPDVAASRAERRHEALSAASDPVDGRRQKRSAIARKITDSALRAKTHGTPKRAMTSPASAGPPERATFTPTMSNLVAARSCVLGTSSGMVACQAGKLHRCADRKCEGESEQEGGGHLPGECEHGEQNADDKNRSGRLTAANADRKSRPGLLPAAPAT